MKRTCSFLAAASFVLVFVGGLLLLTVTPSGCSAPAKPPAQAGPDPAPPGVPAIADAAPALGEDQGKILVQCDPVDAEVLVDGERIGTVEELTQKDGLILSKGLHRIEIQKPGFRAYRLELNLGAQPENINVSLQPMEPAP